MKQIKILLATVLMTMGLTASAQTGDRLNYHKVNVEYSMQKAKMDEGGDVKQNWNSFGVGYSYNIKIGDLPMHVELGAKLNYGFYSGEMMKTPETTASYNVLSATLPVMNLGFDIHLNDDLTLSPYGGISYKIYISGKEKGDTNRNLFDKDEMTTEELWSRSVASWQAGLDVFYKSYFLGVSYTGDLEKTVPQSKSFKSLNFRIGYCF